MDFSQSLAKGSKGECLGCGRSVYQVRRGNWVIERYRRSEREKKKEKQGIWCSCYPIITDVGKAPTVYIVPYWIRDSLEIDGLALPAHVVFTVHIVMSKVSIARMEVLNTTHRWAALIHQRRDSVSWKIYHLRDARCVWQNLSVHFLYWTIPGPWWNMQPDFPFSF